MISLPEALQTEQPLGRESREDPQALGWDHDPRSLFSTYRSSYSAIESTSTMGHDGSGMSRETRRPLSRLKP